jgi:peptide/nickel transport system permease protein
MKLNEALGELWRSGAGKGGVFLLLLLIVGALYVLAAYPLDYGERLWSNPTIWVDNPKAAPPVWVQQLGVADTVEHRTFAAQEPSEVITTKAGQAQLFRFAFDYTGATPPTFLAVTLGNITYAEKPPLITVSLLRPDGKELRLLRHAVRAPREGESGPFQRYHDEPLRIQLSADESTVTNLQEFLEEAFNLRLDTREIEGKVEQIAFGAPIGEGADFAVQPGAYTAEVKATFRGQEDKLGLVRFVVGGTVFGLMGTDSLGRDLAQGLLFGLPVALFIGILVSLVSTAIGTALGITSGYFGGRVDLLIQRAADVVANVPVLPLLIFMLFIIGPSLFVILFILVAFSWTGMTIQVRSMVLHTRTSTLAEAIQSLGASRRRVMFRHILPQIAPYVLSHLIFAAPSAILSEAGLSFLGLGDPSIPTWGQILESGFRTGGIYVGYWWWIIPPGLLIVLTALTFMLISLGLEPVVNPRLRRVR